MTAKISEEKAKAMPDPVRPVAPRELAEQLVADIRFLTARSEQDRNFGPHACREAKIVAVLRAFDKLLEPKATNERCGVALIATERRRQVEAEGWTPAHDNEHREAEMVGAALCYGSCAGQQVRGRTVATDAILEHWPWERSWWKPSSDPIRNLVKAGALIAAEIDRLLAVSPVPWAGSGSGSGAEEEDLTRGHTTGGPQSSRTASKDRG